MKKTLFRLGALAATAASIVSVAAPANAAAPTFSSGYDEAPDLVVVGGSDTSYYVNSLLARAYNTSPGCATNNTVAPFDNCVAGQAAAASAANWDHDIIADSFPYGSGSGRNALANAALTTNDIDLGRSSSGLGTTAAVNSMFEFASEGIGVVAVLPALKARTTGTLAATQAQLQAIYEDGNNVCDSTVTWAQLGDTGPNAADLVLPFGMNSGSGTFGTFNNYVLGTANTGDCVIGQPFENDVAELGKGNAGATQAEMVARRDSGQAIWWISGAVLNKFPVLSAGLSPMQVAGQAYTSTSYALRRNVSMIARDTDAAYCTGAGVPAASCTAAGTLGFAAANQFGKPGAVREYIRWVCRTGNHVTDPSTQNTTTPASYLLVISGAIQNAGFSTTVAGTNTLFGRCRAAT